MLRIPDIRADRFFWLAVVSAVALGVVGGSLAASQANASDAAEDDATLAAMSDAEAQLAAGDEDVIVGPNGDGTLLCSASRTSREARGATVACTSTGAQEPMVAISQDDNGVVVSIVDPRGEVKSVQVDHLGGSESATATDIGGRWTESSASAVDIEVEAIPDLITLTDDKGETIATFRPLQDEALATDPWVVIRPPGE